MVQPSVGASGHYVAEGGLVASSEPTFPGRRGCTCISPRIYVKGEILDVCQRCGLEYRRK